MGSPCRILCLDARESLPDCIDDNLAMESAVLDENPTTVHTRKSRASDIETRHVRLKRVRAVLGHEGLGIQPYPNLTHQGRIGQVASHEQNMIRRQHILSPAVFDNDFLWPDFQ